ncbi:MAG: hypothetical protein ACMUHB_01545 [Thermoplasmatota archaeon]
MNSRLLAVLIVIIMFAAFTISLISIPSRGVTFDPYEVPPGAPRPFSLEGLDKKGDVLKLTVVYKKNPDNTFQERPLEILIMETVQANRNPNIELARNLSVHSWPDVEQRLEDSYVNTRNAQMSLVFYNEMRPGDSEEGNWENATLKIRVDYQVEEGAGEDSADYLMIILVILIVAIVIALGILGFFWVKRRVRDANTFFTSEGGLYYVFKDIDGTILYFTPEQYAQMYNSNALVTYEYIGQSMKKGGPVMTPIDEAPFQEQATAAPMAQPLMASPLEAQPASMPGQEYARQGYHQDPSLQADDEGYSTEQELYPGDGTSEQFDPPLETGGYLDDMEEDLSTGEEQEAVEGTGEVPTSDPAPQRDGEEEAS